MATRKPKAKKSKKPKDNVTYLSELTGENKYASPTVILETYLDEYKNGTTKSEKLLVVALDSDGNFTYRPYHISPDDMILLAAKLHLIGMSEFEQVSDDDNE
jgi:hypothetical protein